MCILHKWTKWEEYNQHMKILPGILAPKEQQGKIYDSFEIWQKRFCEKCGYSQRKPVKEKS